MDSAVNGTQVRSVDDADVRRVVDMLRRGLAVDWNGNGPQVAPRGRLLESMIETARSSRARR